MALAITIVVTLVLVLLGLVGYWRDTRRAVVAIAGTLIGALMVGFWGEPWGQQLAQRMVDGNPRTLTFVISCALFLFCALVVGYGGGVLFGRAKEPPAFSQRLANTFLGLLNGALIIGYVLRFATAQQPESNFTALVQNTPLVRIFHDGLPYLFLILAGGVGALVLVRGALQAVSGRRVVVPPSSTRPTTATTSPAAKDLPASANAAPRAIDDRDILDKINRVR